MLFMQIQPLEASLRCHTDWHIKKNAKNAFQHNAYVRARARLNVCYSYGNTKTGASSRTMCYFSDLETCVIYSYGMFCALRPVNDAKVWADAQQYSSCLQMRCHKVRYLNYSKNLNLDCQMRTDSWWPGLFLLLWTNKLFNLTMKKLKKNK